VQCIEESLCHHPPKLPSPHIKHEDLRRKSTISKVRARNGPPSLPAECWGLSYKLLNE
jgi:hypothetical protein